MTPRKVIRTDPETGLDEIVEVEMEKVELEPTRRPDDSSQRRKNWTESFRDEDDYSEDSFA